MGHALLGGAFQILDCKTRQTTRLSMSPANPSEGYGLEPLPPFHPISFPWIPPQDGTYSSKDIWAVNLDKPDNHWLRLLPYSSLVIFNTGLWYTKGMSPLRQYYTNNGTKRLHIDGVTAANYALRTIARTVAESGYSGRLFWLSMAPTHYANPVLGSLRMPGSSADDSHNNDTGSSNSLSDGVEERVDCGNVTMPFNQEQLRSVAKGAPELWLSKSQKNILSNLPPDWPKWTLLDVTLLSLARPDAHPGRYAGNKDGRRDCTHWCLSGVPDTWADVLFHSFMYKYTLP